MFGIYAATLLPHLWEQPHYIGSALPKYQTACCKFNVVDTDSSYLKWIYYPELRLLK